MKVAYIIPADCKFTNDYINFMYITFPEHNHVFFITKKDCIYINNNIHHYNIEDLNELLNNKEYRNVLENSDKIIYTGVWMSNKCAIKYFFSHLYKKTFFHFWGGDFYYFRNPINSIKKLLIRKIFYFMFRHAAGLVFLIDGEYEKFYEYTKISNKVYIAPMCGLMYDYSKFRESYNNTCEQINVLIGNSSMRTNHHAEVFQMLKHLSQNIQIYCPLSYGEPEYQDEIISLGEKIFRENFHPIKKLMSKEDYLKFLAKMNIGVFYNDRQQAMGNISLMLGLGKKVYLREGTSMWDAFKNKKYKFFSVNNLFDISLRDLLSFDKNDMINNITIFEDPNKLVKYKQAWYNVLNSNIK